MARARGSNVQFLMKRRSSGSYGGIPTGDYWKMPLVGADVAVSQDLVPSETLGLGRDPAAPTLDVINGEGNITVPVDGRYIGLWLTAIFGDPVSTQVKADGTITFSANPSATNTITMNGVTYTFISGSSSGTDIQIKASLSLTLDEVVTVLNASVNASISAATYSKVGTTQLKAEYDTAGTTGNAYTLAASHGTVSAATLEGGGYEHVFSSGEDDALPDYAFEQGHPDADIYKLFNGLLANSIAFDFARGGNAKATIELMVQDEAVSGTSSGGTPQELTYTPFSQTRGELKADGVRIGNLEQAKFSYSNNNEPVNSIREDGLTDGADGGEAAATGSFTTRMTDTTFADKAEAGTAVALEFSYSKSASQKLTFTIHEAYLNRPRAPVEGAGGIRQEFSFIGAKNTGAGKMMTVTLLNDLAGTQYA